VRESQVELGYVDDVDARLADARMQSSKFQDHA
jgi:hypothetical protein